MNLSHSIYESKPKPGSKVIPLLMERTRSCLPNTRVSRIEASGIPDDQDKSISIYTGIPST